jgi:hypothetical protein
MRVSDEMEVETFDQMLLQGTMTRRFGQGDTVARRAHRLVDRAIHETREVRIGRENGLVQAGTVS